MKRSTKVLLSFIGIFLLGAGFVWGFAAHRSGIFPFKLLRSIARGAGVEPPEAKTVATKTAQVGALATLPYTDGTFDPNSGSSGVILHDPERAFPGYNFYPSYTESTVFLLDMDGKVVHEWRFPTNNFAHAQLLPNGDVLGERRERLLTRIDKDSNVLWSYEGEVHHDLSVAEDGRIYAMVHEVRLIPEIHPTVKIQDDNILILTADGVKEDEFSLSDVLLRSPYAFVLPSLAHQSFADDVERRGEIGLDVLHANSVQVFDGRLADRSPRFKKGNLLVSMRNIHTIAILDGETREIVWLWGPGNLTFQHHPVLLDNGHILVFNNGLEASQVLEVDPESRQIVWKYEDPENFFTKTRGSNQRLPNGNTLITESNTGYVFEVSPEGDIVWEFANPDIDPEDVRTFIWRMERFTAEQLPFLQERG